MWLRDTHRSGCLEVEAQNKVSTPTQVRKHLDALLKGRAQECVATAGKSSLDNCFAFVTRLFLEVDLTICTTDWYKAAKDVEGATKSCRRMQNDCIDKYYETSSSDGYLRNASAASHPTSGKC